MQECEVNSVGQYQERKKTYNVFIYKNKYYDINCRRPVNKINVIYVVFFSQPTYE
jgi:hypothetical protein